MKNKIIFKIIIIILLFICIPIANATSKPNYQIMDTTIEYLNKQNWVTDYANILDDKTENKLTETIKNHIKKYNLDIAIVTINFSFRNTTKTFANNYYDHNNIGIGKERDGILLVIDMYHREFYILTNGYTHKLITDSRVEFILDKMEYNMKNGDYEKATTTFLKETEKYYRYHLYGPPFLWIASILVAIGIATYMLKRERKKLDLIKDTLSANDYFVDQEIENQTDTLINTRTRVIHHSSSSGGGSSRGGGSRGGGGRSF